MPFYEYECANCKFYKEVMQKVSDAPLKKCPSCGKNALKKLVSAPVFRLKGAGWYETDFKPEIKKEKAESKDAAGEAKPADKAPEKAADGKAAEGKAAEAKPSAAKAAGETKPASSGTSARRSARKSSARSRTKVKPAGRKRR
jgi:putative FmdB family regulatory protein